MNKLRTIYNRMNDFWRKRLPRLFNMTQREAALFGIYNVAGAFIVTVIVMASYVRYDLLNTDIVLGGWDTSLYIWYAKIVIQYGPIFYMRDVALYPAFYQQLLASLGYLFGSVVLAQRALPVVLGILRMLLFSLICYRISSNVHVAGFSAVLTSVSVGNLWLIGEYHKNSLAYDLALLVILLVSTSGDTIRRRHYLLIPLLFFLIAGTQIENMALLFLSLAFSAILMVDWRKLLLYLFSSILAVGIIALAFPEWLGWYFLHGVQWAYVIPPTQTNIHDLVFWSIGSWLLLPIIFLGLFSMYEKVRSGGKREATLPILMLTIIILISSLIALNIQLESYAIRGILLLPVPIILALGVEEILHLVRRFSIKLRLGRLENRSLPFLSKEKIVKITGILLSAMVIFGLAFMDSGPYGMHYERLGVRTPMEFTANVLMTPFVKVSAYSKIVSVGHFLESNNLQVPIFMFEGDSFYVAELYRAYIYDVIGEHLAYLGNLSNLVNLRPTASSSNSTLVQELYNFTSAKFLAIMLGDKKYNPVIPQTFVIKDRADLLARPLVYVAPEIYNAVIPSCVLNDKFKVEDGVYVVPSISEIVNEGFP